MQIRTDDAVKFFGTAADLAERLGISPQAIYQWGEFVPERRVYQIHVLSDRALPPDPPGKTVAAQAVNQKPAANPNQQHPPNRPRS